MVAILTSLTLFAGGCEVQSSKIDEIKMDPYGWEGKRVTLTGEATRFGVNLGDNFWLLAKKTPYDLSGIEIDCASSIPEIVSPYSTIVKVEGVVEVKSYVPGVVTPYICARSWTYVQRPPSK